MSEFMLILPGGTASPEAAGEPDVDPKILVRKMELCLAGLDRLDAGIAAAHLAMAIDQARIRFDLGRDDSETD